MILFEQMGFPDIEGGDPRALVPASEEVEFRTRVQRTDVLVFLAVGVGDIGRVHFPHCKWSSLDDHFHGIGGFPFRNDGRSEYKRRLLRTGCGADSSSGEGHRHLFPGPSGCSLPLRAMVSRSAREHAIRGIGDRKGNDGKDKNNTREKGEKKKSICGMNEEARKVPGGVAGER